MKAGKTMYQHVLLQIVKICVTCSIYLHKDTNVINECDVEMTYFTHTSDAHEKHASYLQAPRRGEASWTWLHLSQAPQGCMQPAFQTSWGMQLCTFPLVFCGHSCKVSAAINVTITKNAHNFGGLKSGLPVTHIKCDILVQQGLSIVTFPHLDVLLIKRWFECLEDLWK